MATLNVGPAPTGTPYETFPIADGVVFVGTLTIQPGTVEAGWETATVVANFEV